MEHSVQRMAKAHQECLPTSLLSLLGFQVLCRFYRFVSQSEDEELFILRDNDAIGVSVLSKKPDTLLKRFIGYNLLPVTYHIVLSLFVKPLFRRIFLKKFFSKGGAFFSVGQDVELIILFVESPQRRKGLGSRLIRVVEQYLRENNIGCYIVKTVARESNSALFFYRKLDFAVVGKGFDSGKEYIYLKKELAFCDG